MAALDLDDREAHAKARRTGLQLDRPAKRPLGLIEAVESREIVGEPAIPVRPQRLGGERLPRERYRPLQLTGSGELLPEVELRIGVVRRELQRTPILGFRPAPVEISD